MRRNKEVSIEGLGERGELGKSHMVLEGGVGEET